MYLFVIGFGWIVYEKKLVFKVVFGSKKGEMIYLLIRLYLFFVFYLFQFVLWRVSFFGYLIFWVDCFFDGYLGSQILCCVLCVFFIFGSGRNFGYAIGWFIVEGGGVEWVSQGMVVVV